MADKEFKIYSFPVSIAKEYDINVAILLMHICYWATVNEMNGINYHHGYFWTYDSVKSLHEKHPYFSVSTINRTLKKLLSEELILKDRFNKRNYDKTNWYTLSPKGRMLMAPVIDSLKAGKK